MSIFYIQVGPVDVHGFNKIPNDSDGLWALLALCSLLNVVLSFSLSCRSYTQIPNMKSYVNMSYNIFPFINDILYKKL